MKAIYLFTLIFMISIVSAAPFQLNLSTGDLIDLNITNETANITIYVISSPIYNYTNVTQNITQEYITKITNETCLNCTNDYTNTTNTKLYVSNYTYLVDSSNGTFYNKEEIDSKFKTIEDINILSSELNSKIDSINQSVIKKVEVKSNKPIWIISILGLVLAFISLFILWRSG